MDLASFSLMVGFSVGCCREDAAARARASAFSFPGIPEWPGIHISFISIPFSFDCLKQESISSDSLFDGFSLEFITDCKALKLSDNIVYLCDEPHSLIHLTARKMAINSIEKIDGAVEHVPDKDISREGIKAANPPPLQVREPSVKIAS